MDIIPLNQHILHIFQLQSALLIRMLSIQINILPASGEILPFCTGIAGQLITQNPDIAAVAKPDPIPVSAGDPHMINLHIFGIFQRQIRKPVRNIRKKTFRISGGYANPAIRLSFQRNGHFPLRPFHILQVQSFRKRRR